MALKRRKSDLWYKHKFCDFPKHSLTVTFQITNFEKYSDIYRVNMTFETILALALPISILVAVNNSYQWSRIKKSDRS